jgi:hypothetical protein
MNRKLGRKDDQLSEKNHEIYVRSKQVKKIKKNKIPDKFQR